MGVLPQSKSGSKVLAGARAFFTFNGVIVGYASGINGGEEIQYEPVDTLDHLETREHVPVGYRVSFSATMFRTIAAAAGISTEDSPGSIKEQQIFPKFGQILMLEGVSVMIQDSITKKTLYMLTTVKAQSHSWQLSARGLTSTQVQFVAIKQLDESEIGATAIKLAA